MANLDCPHIYNFLLVRERKPSQRKAYDPDDEKNDSDACNWFHLISLLIRASGLKQAIPITQIESFMAWSP